MASSIPNTQYLLSNLRRNNGRQGNRFYHHGGRARRGRGAGGRRRDAGLRLHGQGAHQRVQDDPLHDVPARRRSRGWSRCAGATRRRWRRRRSATATRRTTPTGARCWPTTAFKLFDNGGRTTRTPSRASRRRRRASTSSARSRWRAPPRRRNGCSMRSTKAGVKHMVAFNYRFVPAIRQARNLIESGALGQIYHFRAVYLQEWIMPHYEHPADLATRQGDGRQRRARRPRRAHHRPGPLPRRRDRRTRQRDDQAPSSPSALLADGSGMAKVDVDDAFVAAVEFENGAIGTLEATRFAGGRKNYQVLEINGEKGTDPLQPGAPERARSLLGGRGAEGDAGLPQRARHRGLPPLLGKLVAAGAHHRLGAHLRPRDRPTCSTASSTTRTSPRYGATFDDGYRAAVICDAILESAQARRQVDIRY